MPKLPYKIVTYEVKVQYGTQFQAGEMFDASPTPTAEIIFKGFASSFKEQDPLNDVSRKIKDSIYPVEKENV